MSGSLCKPLRSAPAPRWRWVIGASVGLLLLAGCSTERLADTVIGPGYHPANVFCRGATLPAGVRRVAILPQTCEGDSSALAAGRETLAPVLDEELAKTGKFEVVLVSPEELQARTGRASWRADEKLPADFFRALKDAYGCDAVLFSQLTVFRAYPPLAVGWRLKLVARSGSDIVWAADEVFDAGQPAVVNGARRYQQEQQRGPSSHLDSQGIINSPRWFGRYAANTLLATLPAR